MNSFDFFDTLVVRRLPRTEHVAAVMELTLAWPGFAALRAKAEQEARRAQANRPPTLAQIYACLASDTRRDIALAEELRLERELLVPLPANLRRMQAGDIIVADTHHTSAFVAELLSAAGVKRPPAMQLSCERGASKHDGRLWQALLAEGQKPQVHVGSDARADVKEPQRLGIAVLPFADSAFSHWEQAALAAPTSAVTTTTSAHDALAGLLAAAVAGCARAARLAHLDPAEPAHESRLCDIAGAALAPALLAFVDHALDRCMQLSISRACFLAPHGQLLFRLAQQRVRTRGLKLELLYIHGSAQAFASAAAKSYCQQVSQQLSLKPDTPLAVVGLGFDTAEQGALSTLLASDAAHPPRLHGLYFSLAEPAHHEGVAPAEAFAAGATWHTQQPMLRALLQADEGAMLGYEMKKRRAWPVLAPRPDAATLRAVQLQQGAVLAFAREWAALEAATRGALRLSPNSTLRVLQQFLTQPTRADAQAFERRVGDAGGGGAPAQPLVKRLAAGAALARGESWGLWPEGSLALMGGTPLAPLMKLVRRLQKPPAGLGRS